MTTRHLVIRLREVECTVPAGSTLLLETATMAESATFATRDEAHEFAGRQIETAFQEEVDCE